MPQTGGHHGQRLPRCDAAVLPAINPRCLVLPCADLRCTPRTFEDAVEASQEERQEDGREGQSENPDSNAREDDPSREDGRLRINSEPPLLVPVAELDLTTVEVEGDVTAFKVETIYGGWREYVDNLPDDRKSLLRRYQPVDCALRVGGVGSVGTRCSIMLLQGEGPDDAILLQLKEAGTSVLEPHLPKASYASQGERVVTGQRLIQAVSDIFLGWHTSHASGVDYYWRQFKDLKGSVDIGGLDEQALSTYLKVCAICLARAHARTGDAAAIGGYIGKGGALSEAIADFSVTYAGQPKTTIRLWSRRSRKAASRHRQGSDSQRGRSSNPTQLKTKDRSILGLMIMRHGPSFVVMEGQFAPLWGGHPVQGFERAHQERASSPS